MIRIRYDVLEYENERYYYDKQLFTGIAFEIKDTVVKKRLIFQEGMIEGSYISPYFVENKKDIWVDYSALIGANEEDEEPFLFEGKLFTGNACEMNGHFCEREFQIENGNVIVEVEFNLNGNIFSLNDISSDIAQDFHWFDDGSISSIHLQVVDEFRVSFEFYEKSKIEEISISGKYFENIPKYISCIKYNDFPFNYNFSSSLTISHKLFLSFEGVNDTVFIEIQKCKGFEKIRDLTLYCTSISGKNLKALKRCHSLEILSIDDDSNDKAQIVKSLKQDLPQCTIIYNDEEVL